MLGTRRAAPAGQDEEGFCDAFANALLGLDLNIAYAAISRARVERWPKPTLRTYRDRCHQLRSARDAKMGSHEKTTSQTDFPGPAGGTLRASQDDHASVHGDIYINELERLLIDRSTGSGSAAFVSWEP